MDLKQIKDTVASDRYSFLKENEHLGNRIILLGLVWWVWIKQSSMVKKKENLIQGTRQLIMNAGITEVVLGAERTDYIQLKYKKNPPMLDWKNMDKKKKLIDAIEEQLHIETLIGGIRWKISPNSLENRKKRRKILWNRLHLQLVLIKMEDIKL